PARNRRTTPTTSTAGPSVTAPDLWRRGPFHALQCSTNAEYRMVDWQPIWTAPLNREIAVAVLDRDGYHAFVFPLYQTWTCWVSREVSGLIPITPTHWRELTVDRQGTASDGASPTVTNRSRCA